MLRRLVFLLFAVVTVAAGLTWFSPPTAQAFSFNNGGTTPLGGTGNTIIQPFTTTGLTASYTVDGAATSVTTADPTGRVAPLNVSGGVATNFTPNLDVAQYAPRFTTAVPPGRARWPGSARTAAP